MKKTGNQKEAPSLYIVYCEGAIFLFHRVFICLEEKS